MFRQLAICLLAVCSVEAATKITDVMSEEEQEETGISTLSSTQVTALEKWLDGYRKKAFSPTIDELRNRGAQVRVLPPDSVTESEIQVYMVHPNDRSVSRKWLAGQQLEIKIVGTNQYKYRLINQQDGANQSVLAKRVYNRG